MSDIVEAGPARNLTEPEARRLTDEIADRLAKLEPAVTAIREQIAVMHDRKGYEALGYRSWAAYVAKEFPGMDRRYSYRLIDAGRTGDTVRGAARGLGRPVESVSRDTQSQRDTETGIERAVRAVAPPITRIGADRAQWAGDVVEGSFADDGEPAAPASPIIALATAIVDLGDLSVTDAEWEREKGTLYEAGRMLVALYDDRRG